MQSNGYLYMWNRGKWWTRPVISNDTKKGEIVDGHTFHETQLIHASDLLFEWSNHTWGLPTCRFIIIDMINMEYYY